MNAAEAMAARTAKTSTVACNFLLNAAIEMFDAIVIGGGKAVTCNFLLNAAV